MGKDEKMGWKRKDAGAQVEHAQCSGAAHSSVRGAFFFACPARLLCFFFASPPPRVQKKKQKKAEKSQKKLEFAY